LDKLGLSRLQLLQSAFCFQPLFVGFIFLLLQQQVGALLLSDIPVEKEGYKQE
jgi:hypothetical protein